MVGASVTIFVPSLAGGGAERVMCVVANGLSQRGACVTLMAASADGPYRADVRPDVRVVDLGVPSVSRGLAGLLRHLRASPPKALLCAMSHANVVGALAHRLAGSKARLVLSEHNHLSSSIAQGWNLRMRVTQALMRVTYPWADRVISVSAGVAQDLVCRNPALRGRVETIYNPVVTGELHRLSLAAPAHPWLTTRDVPVVLTAGRLTPQKDFTTLLDAFARLRRRRSVRLLILGQGEMHQSLLAQATQLGVADDVALPGFEPNPFAAMRAASVFVLSSRYEGLSNVLIEAMACGARVVSTDCPSGPNEVLEGGRWGRLVPVGDAAALAEGIASALDDPRPPSVRVRAQAFNADQAIDRYAKVLGLC